MHTFLVGKDGVMSSRYDAETKARAVRLVREHVGDYDSEWAAITAVAGRLGMSAEMHIALAQSRCSAVG